MDKKKTDCNICGKTIAKTNLKRHLNIHEKNRIFFACTLCNKKYTRKDKLSKHIRDGECSRKHLIRTTTENSNLQIPSTSGVNTRKVSSILKTQENTSRPINNGIYLCSLCGKQYKHEKNLKNHEDICQKLRYECTKCGREFHSRNRLKRHGCRLLSFPFKCLTCHRGFFYKKIL